jgi:hypothetical protein
MSRCSPSSLFAIPYFTTAAFYLFLKVKSELASSLLTKGIFKKSLQGVTPTTVIEKLAAAVLE